eukprot:8637271-Karenia_brevis.AAC.1
MFAQSEKRLEIVVPKVIHMDFDKLLETDISQRSPTWVYAILVKYYLPSVKGWKRMQGQAPLGALARKLQNW